MALASSSVRSGRRIRSQNSLPAAKLAMLILLDVDGVGPHLANEVSIWSPKPRMSEVMPTIDVTPMTTPRIVSADRSLLVTSVPTAIERISASRP